MKSSPEKKQHSILNEKISKAEILSKQLCKSIEECNKKILQKLLRRKKDERVLHSL